jgi:hypothetical protein
LCTAGTRSLGRRHAETSWNVDNDKRATHTHLMSIDDSSVFRITVGPESCPPPTEAAVPRLVGAAGARSVVERYLHDTPEKFELIATTEDDLVWGNRMNAGRVPRDLSSVWIVEDLAQHIAQEPPEPFPRHQQSTCSLGVPSWYTC